MSVLSIQEAITKLSRLNQDSHEYERTLDVTLIRASVDQINELITAMLDKEPDVLESMHLTIHYDSIRALNCFYHQMMLRDQLFPCQSFSFTQHKTPSYHIPPPPPLAHPLLPIESEEVKTSSGGRSREPSDCVPIRLEDGRGGASSAELDYLDYRLLEGLREMPVTHVSYRGHLHSCQLTDISEFIEMASRFVCPEKSLTLVLSVNHETLPVLLDAVGRSGLSLKLSRFELLLEGPLQEDIIPDVCALIRAVPEGTIIHFPPDDQSSSLSPSSFNNILTASLLQRDTPLVLNIARYLDAESPPSVISPEGQGQFILSVANRTFLLDAILQASSLPHSHIILPANMVLELSSILKESMQHAYYPRGMCFSFQVLNNSYDSFVESSLSYSDNVIAPMRPVREHTMQYSAGFCDLSMALVHVSPKVLYRFDEVKFVNQYRPILPNPTYGGPNLEVDNLPLPLGLPGAYYTLHFALSLNFQYPREYTRSPTAYAIYLLYLISGKVQASCYKFASAIYDSLPRDIIPIVKKNPVSSIFSKNENLPMDIISSDLLNILNFVIRHFVYCAPSPFQNFSLYQHYQQQFLQTNLPCRGRSFAQFEALTEQGAQADSQTTIKNACDSIVLDYLHGELIRAAETAERALDVRPTR